MKNVQFVVLCYFVQAVQLQVTEWARCYLLIVTYCVHVDLEVAIHLCTVYKQMARHRFDSFCQVQTGDESGSIKLYINK